MNWLDAIIQILSNHRHPHDGNLPQALTRSQLTHLLKNCPNLLNQTFPTHHIHNLLTELTARGEILAGIGRRYCMAPPTVLAPEDTIVNGIRFQGDRAYLSLAHQILETDQNYDEVLMRPKLHRWQSVQERLAHVGVRAMTFTQQINHLPKLRQLSQPELRSPWPDAPFCSTQAKQTIWHYVPQAYANQSERWQRIETKPTADSLMRLHSGDYLWYDTQVFYELEPDTALLTAFWLDQEHKLPLKLPWDSSKGLLDLSQARLPSTYARQVWALSDAASDHYRTRYIAPVNRPLVVEILQQLGCQLV